MGNAQAVALYRADGALLARHPRMDSLLGRTFPGNAVFQEPLLSEDRGVEHLTSPLDHMFRIAAKANLTRYPIIAVVSRPMMEGLAQWRIRTAVLVAATLLLQAGIVALVWLAGRQLRSLRQIAHTTITAERERNDG